MHKIIANIHPYTNSVKDIHILTPKYIYIYIFIFYILYIYINLRDIDGEGNGIPLQYSCLENPMDRGPHGRLQSMGSLRVGHD